MRSLITLVLSLSLINPALAYQTDDLNNCKAAIDAADNVIKRQSDLILIQVDYITEVNNANQTLEKTIKELSSELESKNNQSIVYGALGIALGVLVTSFVNK